MLFKNISFERIPEPTSFKDPKENENLNQIVRVLKNNFQNLEKRLADIFYLLEDNHVTMEKVSDTAITAAGTLTLPAGTYIDKIIIDNTTANAVTGGLKIGTTLGGVDIVAAQAVGANAFLTVPDADILLHVFGAEQILYIDAVTSFNSASLDITVIYGYY